MSEPENTPEPVDDSEPDKASEVKHYERIDPRSGKKVTVKSYNRSKSLKRSHLKFKSARKIEDVVNT